MQCFQYTEKMTAFWAVYSAVTQDQYGCYTTSEK